MEHGWRRGYPKFGAGQLASVSAQGLRHCSILQVVLIVSGNLSFLNWLTIVPSVACFDDATLGFLFPSGPGSLKDQVLKMQKEGAREARPTLTYGGWTPGDVDRRPLFPDPGELVPRGAGPFFSSDSQAHPMRAVIMTQFPSQPRKVSLAGGMEAVDRGSCPGWGQQHHPPLL